MTEKVDSERKAGQGGLIRVIERLVPRWAGRADTEHEQAVIRLLVGGLAAIYLLYLQIRGDTPVSLFNPVLLTISGFFFLTATIFIWLYHSPGVSVPRRLLGAVTDLGLTSLAMYLNGNLAAPMFCIYLWVTFGNGFRYGRRYLFVSMLISVSGFSLVLLFSPNWNLPNHVSLALLVGLIVLPLYVAALLGRLTQALAESDAANKIKSNFLSIMSHEIRTPLSGIVGVISLLKQHDLSDEQYRYLKIIEKSAERLSRILFDGLDYSKIEAGELIIENRPYLLRESIDKVVSPYHRLAEARDLDFIFLFDEQLPQAVLGDRKRLEQILSTLLSNSFKFTESGTIILKITLQSLTDEGAIVGFSVSDTGIGIPVNLHETIFEPFQQLDSSTKRRKEGSGLGLTICSRLVNLFGSRLELVSEPGKGSIFRFDLCLPIVEEFKGDTLIVNEHFQPHWLRSPRVLLVEDNTTNQEVVSSLLESLGCETEVASNGQQGVEKAADSSFDLIFMDCQMPIMDGYEATRNIRAGSFEKDQEIPIVALTAHVTVADREQCMDAGMSDYQGKPCSLGDLKLILLKWLPDLLDHEKSQVNGTVAEGVSASITERETQSVVSDKNNRNHVHELRNCYTKILGCAELIMLGRLSPEKVSRNLSVICEEVRKATEISEKIS